MEYQGVTTVICPICKELYIYSLKYSDCCPSCVEEQIPLSSCCAVEMHNWPDSDLCPQCKEHTGILEE